MTEFIVMRLKGAEHRDWMQSRQPLPKAIEIGDLSLPGLVDVVSNIIGVLAAHCLLPQRDWQERQRR